MQCCCLFFYALSFNLIICNGGISFRSGNDGFICWRSLGMVMTHLACMVQRLGCAFFSSLSSSCLSLPWTLPELTHYNITAFLFLLLSHHLLDMLSLFISSTSFLFSAPRVSMVTTFILINLWSLESSPPGHCQCFIHVNFTFFPVDTLSLHQCFILNPIGLVNL